MQTKSRRCRRSAVDSPAAPRTRHIVASFLVPTVLAVLAVGAATPAGAETPAPAPETTADAVRWTVKPADAERADGRVRIEITADAGATIEDHIAVKNVGDADTTFALTAADGLFNRNGRFDMLPAGEESVDAGTWIEIVDSVAVPAGKTVVVPFTVTIPDNATPGDHEAGVAASILSTADGMRVVSRSGVRVAIHVNGEVTPDLDMVVTSADYHASWNPFRPGRVELHYELANNGNVRLDGDGEVTVSAPFGLLAARSTYDIKDVAPGQPGKGVIVLEGVWPGFRDTADVTLAPRAVDGAPAVSHPPIHASIGWWAIPWSQVALLVLAAALVALAVHRKRGTTGPHRRHDADADGPRTVSQQAAVNQEAVAVGRTAWHSTTDVSNDED